MPVSFEELKIGKEYDRPYLANLWGYKGFQAIARGVVTPVNSKFIILFVTRDKQEVLTQYNDYLDGQLLHWEGEEKHSSDNRIVNSESLSDKIYLFYRDIHHSPFVYYGEIFLKEHKLRTTEPSQFIFHVGQEQTSIDLLDDIESHQDEYGTLNQTEKDSIVKSRIGQGLFRDRVIALWGCCSVTGLRNLSLLRASHIKPWRNSSNQERLDPMNGLLLQPTLDHLFDLGFIAFDADGTVIISSKISEDDAAKLNLTCDMKLRKLPSALMDYIAYHRDNVFQNV